MHLISLLGFWLDEWWLLKIRAPIEALELDARPRMLTPFEWRASEK